MENRISDCFSKRKDALLNIYFTAGFPALQDTRLILKLLADSGADLVEIGVPYSDPIADGPTIQGSNEKALQNGMSLQMLFAQLEGMRTEIQIPVLLMGYINTVLQFGVENFCKACQKVGVDGVIFPDLPLAEFECEYKALFQKYQLANVFLITPQTSAQRIRKMDETTHGFLYMVAASAVTGGQNVISDKQIAYFKSIQAMQLKNPKMIGFGISDHESFSTACQYAEGAIVGSAFIRLLEKSKNLQADIPAFVQGIKGLSTQSKP